MSLFSTLHVGASGLRAAQLQIGNSSQNLANAATPGYTRRAVAQEPVPGPPQSGLGVRTHSPARVIDRFVERRLLGASSDRAEANARMSALGVLDQVLAEDVGGVGEAMRAFETSLRELSANPGDLALRSQVLSAADSMSRAFRAAGTQLQASRTEIDQRITDGVDRVNSLTSDIAALGREIGKAEVAGDEAVDLRDQRDQKIRDLAELVPVEVIEHANGGVAVLLGGRQALVSEDGRAHALRAAPDPVTGAMRIEQVNAGVAEDVSAAVTAGELGGFLTARSSGLAQAEADLDQLAFDVASAYNTAHQAGFGLDGTGGRNLFAPIAAVTGAAAAMQVSADVAGTPANLAAATDPTLVPGDNRNMLALSALSTTRFALGGTATGAESLAMIIRTGGGALATAEADSARTTGVEAQVGAIRESVSGVNTDEEMVALMQHQRAYQASLKIVQMADDLLGELMNLAR